MRPESSEIGEPVASKEYIATTRFTEIAFSLHAGAAQDEMRELADEFRSLIERTSVKTPNIDLLKDYVNEYKPDQTAPRDGL